MVVSYNPYDDGTSAYQIVSLLESTVGSL